MVEEISLILVFSVPFREEDMGQMWGDPASARGTDSHLSLQPQYSLWLNAAHHTGRSNMGTSYGQVNKQKDKYRVLMF